MSQKVKVGVFGGGRGQAMIDILARHPDAQLTAVCDLATQKLERCVQLAESLGSVITTYTDFDAFIEHEMDAVVLANYATEHAPYAIRVLDSGRHVCSEVLACQAMSEALGLVEAVERSGKIYAYAENYCYFRGTLEMRNIYRRGDLGEFLHGEGEYVHDCESIWADITNGDSAHWRNWAPSTFYCTHSIGPICTITGTRPTRVTAYETSSMNVRRLGRDRADGAVILCQMSNGATAKFLPWCSFKRVPEAIWYAVYGTKGMAETDRWGKTVDGIHVYLEEQGKVESYEPEFPFSTELSAQVSGHGGSDFYTLYFFLNAILGRQDKEYLIDVYQALDMTFPGILGYRSIVNGNIPLDIPDFRDKSLRNDYRGDDWCLDPKLAGLQKSV